MNVLVARQYNGFQIVAVCISRDEATELIRGYWRDADPDNDFCPEWFELYSSFGNGYKMTEKFEE